MVESERQRRVQETGSKLEVNVRKILNQILSKKDIEAFSVSQISRWAKTDGVHRKLLNYLKVEIKNSCSQDQSLTLPDTDIVVVYKEEDKVNHVVKAWHPLCIVSCKVSFHARETEALFWAQLVRPQKIKYVLVTEDADRYGQKNQSELKTCETGNKPRKLLECFLDRIYIIKKYDQVNNGIVTDIDTFYHVFERAEAQGYRGIESRIFDDYERKPHAEYCKNVRPFDDLLFDIMNWKFEELRHFNVSKASPNEFSQQK